MRGRHRTSLATAAALLFALVAANACGDDEPAPGSPGGRADVEKTPATERALRRAFDGAPPVIAHEPLGTNCTSCHNEQGIEIAGRGFAPPSPHANMDDPSSMSRCEQCHVYAVTDEVFRQSHFVGLAQDLRKGERLNPEAPPVMPHQTLLRENCAACHTGKAAREEIRCPHPERVRCRQCHVPVVTQTVFRRPG